MRIRAVAVADPPPAAPGSFFRPTSPTQVLDTRDTSPVGADGSITLDLSTVVAASGYDTYVLAADGSVWAWGANDAGQLGGGSARTAPAQVPDLSGITRSGAGGEHAYAVTG